MAALERFDQPRDTLAALATERGDSLAGLSRLIGKNAAYLQQFVKRGSPRALADRERQILAQWFRIDERKLGGACDPAVG